MLTQGADMAAVSNRGESALHVAKGTDARRYLEGVLGEEKGASAGAAASSGVARKGPKDMGNAADHPLHKKGGISGKAKKEYLQWKRAKKRGQGEESEGEDAGPGPSGRRGEMGRPQAQGVRRPDKGGETYSALRATELRQQEGGGARWAIYSRVD